MNWITEQDLILCSYCHISFLEGFICVDFIMLDFYRYLSFLICFFVVGGMY